MSLQSLNLDYPKAWENGRVNNIQVDNELILPRNLTAYTKTGSGGTLNITGNETHFYVAFTAGTILADTTASFTLNNTKITSSNNLILAKVEEFTGVWGADGLPTILVDGITTGACNIHVTNVSNLPIPNVPSPKVITFEVLIIEN